MPKPFFNRRVLAALPPSTQKGLRELEDDFLRMKHNDFSDQPFISQIKRSLEVFARSLDEAICSPSEASLIGSQLDSIEDGIQFINRAITNRLQSGRYLYEANPFNPQNMGSFSKLYTFYELLVDLFEGLIVVYDQKKKEPHNHQLDFLVDVSTYSSVRAQLFVPLRCEEPPRNELIGITISEQAFFQVQDAIIILLHEMGHYVRPYDRAKRNHVLMQVFIDWIANLVFNELNSHLYDEVLASYGEIKTDPEKAKIDAVRELFEKRLWPAVTPIITTALFDYLQHFFSTETVISLFGKKDQYRNRLGDLHRLMNLFIDDFSDHLNETLFARKERKSGYRIKKVMRGLLQKVVEGNNVIEDEKDDQRISYFEQLCEIATELFETSEYFEYKKGVGNSVPDLAIESYLRSLSLLGLNGLNEQNVNLFTDVILQCIKKSVDAIRKTDIVEILVRSLDEALAHMFWIRALDIRDFTSYWKIAEPLMNPLYYGKINQVNYFATPNAIITEYFYLLEEGKSPDEPSYKIPLTEVLTSHFNTGNLQTEAQEVQSTLRYIFFVPVAQYLTQANDIFPEDNLFQLKKNIPISNNGKLVSDFRAQFKMLVEANESGNKFDGEIEMIKFLLDSTMG